MNKGSEMIHAEIHRMNKGRRGASSFTGLSRDYGCLLLEYKSYRQIY